MCSVLQPSSHSWSTAATWLGRWIQSGLQACMGRISDSFPSQRCPAPSYDTCCSSHRKPKFMFHGRHLFSQHLLYYSDQVFTGCYALRQVFKIRSVHLSSHAPFMVNSARPAIGRERKMPFSALSGTVTRYTTFEVFIFMVSVTRY